MAASSRRTARGASGTAAAFLLSLIAGAGARPASATPVPPEILAQVAPPSAGAAGAPKATLVEKGRQLFTSETFGGNGRTCSTCHRPDHNYTIDAKYIARLPASDPIFTAERVPALKGLDNPKLLRGLGLVSVNVDGLDKPAVERAVPHLLGLSQSMRPKAGDLVRGGRNLAAALGWSGDGAPGGGSLREFIVGAIVQHLPKSLGRVAGKDYRVPSADELAALEAFLLSLGRQDEFDIARMRLTSPAAERGRVLFQDPKSGPCTLCHVNAGANLADGTNAMRDVGIQNETTTPAEAIDPKIPGDGGFGVAPTRAAGKPAYGDGRFNTPSLVEAADTGPLFHDHSIDSVEQAVLFYTSTVFFASPEGRKLKRIRLLRPEITDIGAFLRALNVMDNLRSSGAMLQKALGQADVAAGREAIRLGAADTADAIKDLTDAGGLYPDVLKLLYQAQALEQKAAAAAAAPARDPLLRQAIDLKARARAQMTMAG